MSFFDGEACPDDNLKGILSIYLKLCKYIHSIKIWKSLNWAIHPLISARMKTSLISWIVSTDRPKGRRGIPSWNLSLVLHQLTKAPFEPIKEASLKHLTFKTVFVLALGSGKRRSEIHAWQSRNIRH